MNKEYLILYYENRIAKLNNNPTLNRNLINKTKRKLRAFKEKQ